jgi:hypothetical protein
MVASYEGMVASYEEMVASVVSQDLVDTGDVPTLQTCMQESGQTAVLHNVHKRVCRNMMCKRGIWRVKRMCCTWSKHGKALLTACERAREREERG